ncbi:MAG: right-handed parallel beta-helix repeat-containing protein [Chitinophagaceae bacterium]|nr:right-handed parallel beta-helix repeat-containing protein [Chitinophagaceae bacterium]
MSHRLLRLFIATTITGLFSPSVNAQSSSKTGITSSQISANQQTWFVAGSGNDANNGLSNKTAFRTLNKAASVAGPGDFVTINDGIYTEDQAGASVLSITKSGTPDAWITWKSAPGANPEIRPSGWNGILITGSYHVIDGINIVGGNDGITLLDALEDAKKTTSNSRFNTNGIFVNGRNNPSDNKPHHIIIRNCSVSKCPGGGIVAIQSDYITVEDCTVFENAWYMRYAGSGITTLNNWAFDNKSGYHVIIQRNVVWSNKTLVPWEKTGNLSDGNGILLDVTDVADGATNPNADTVVNRTPVAQASNPSLRPEWSSRALIANNISAFNGGSGIHTFRTKHVDIINNTTYWNGSVVNYQELFPNRSEDIVILNNIIVPRPGGKVTSNNKNKNIRWDYNLYPQPQTIFYGLNDIVADPIFKNIQECLLAKISFQLQKSSKGLNSGTNDLTQSMDIARKKRFEGGGIDRGAYEQ